MNTFLPYPDIPKSVKCLDDARLNKQREEAAQIYDILTGASAINNPDYNKLPGKGKQWAHHPAVLMWKGYENALAVYHNECLKEWLARGKNAKAKPIVITGKVVLPPWFGDEAFHRSQRSNLLRKDKEFYGKYGWKDPDNLPYVWPAQHLNPKAKLAELLTRIVTNSKYQTPLFKPEK